MAITKKQIYWGIGIGATLITVGGLIYRHRKKIKKAAKKAENWIRPVAAKISSSFGKRIHPITKKEIFHNGIDLAIPVNTPIKSPMPGIVYSVISEGDGGNQVIIKHNNGYKTGYAHLNKALVEKGDKVAQGDVIALSGNTGKSTGPHLHFTLTDPFGAKVDPQKVIYSGVV